jgi:tRNA 2-selenouridine synthase
MTCLSPKLSASAFLEFSKRLPVIDVRSPAEFSHGHIPGAFSLPLFDDLERAEIGTLYAEQGKEAALHRGLDLVGPKLTLFVRTAKEIAQGEEILVHCWRGGMRSEAMAWLLRFSGIETAILKGGYKEYRQFIKQSFASGPPVIVLGGMTGSGKTELLHHMESQGEQVIDLEGIAHHKGSAFGSLGQLDQPSQEQFENDLASKWLALDSSRQVWVEDESRNIGKVIIPDTVFNKMANSKVIFIEMPFEDRVKRLVKEYGSFRKETLSSVIIKIHKRIGGDVAQDALKALEENDVQTAVSIILKYYDKTYEYGLSKRDKNKILRINYAEFRRGYAALHRGSGEIRKEIEN